MTKPHKQKFRLTLKIIVILLIVIGIYLNRAYSYIYSELGQAGLSPSDNTGMYTLNNSSASSSAGIPSQTLVYDALGDSLTAGVGTANYSDSYPYLVAQELANLSVSAGANRRVVLQDMGIPGERTKGLLADVVPLVISNHPAVITVLIGVNDIHGNISLKTFRQNYATILSRLTQETTAKIYIISIPFIGASNLMLPPYQWYFDYQTQRFNAVIRDLAGQYGVNYIDLYTPTVNLFKNPGSEYSADLFHPSAAGYKVWAKIIYDNINH